MCVLSIYPGVGDPKDIFAAPDANGWICSSHIIILHRNMIYDPSGGRTEAVEEVIDDLGERYCKRIFRVIPADHDRGL